MSKNLFLLLLLIYIPICCRGKHLLRFLVFCQRDEPDDGQWDIEYDGDQLLHVDPPNFTVIPRLPEFSQQWTPDPHLRSDAYLDLGTCKYNLGIIAKREDHPPEVIDSPTSMIYTKQHIELGVPNVLICFVDNFHPPEVEITWTRNGEHVDEGVVRRRQYYSNSDFGFRTSAYLNFTPEASDIYSCSVDHISLQEPLTKFWEVEVHPNTQNRETALCVCGVILGLTGIVIGLWFIRKANKSCRA
ncbi:H-2 class II histocompatibility antigen, A-U alpha chain-like [Solea senegalensis]|uniref:H-2 class II histocompatibility antigen, A-U alpha chain-like n=1 Tax=Solea senegalensis TaxID=28829 RepID=A0AAV6PQE3_SOLSE|nr:H-2 class II histocompatibility antigen, A-U alpha chain-like [Solea senegalensis]KAG7474216.1 H-2 class II histocompatibility antigen, A-U alpha chain-like [Solea senegalensis]